MAELDDMGKTDIEIHISVHDNSLSIYIFNPNLTYNINM